MPFFAWQRLSSSMPLTASPSRDIFVLLVPEAATEHHLQLLSELAQMFSDKAFRERLATATDAAAPTQLFAQWSCAN